MKKITTLLFSLLLLVTSAKAADVVLAWDQGDTNTYSKVYWQVSGNVGTNIASIPLNVTFYTNSSITTNVLYSFFVTARFTQDAAALESEPSNKIRYQRVHTVNKSNPISYLTNSSMTNWVLRSSPTNGILSGTPPNVTYTKTNATATKDRWTYTTGEMFSSALVTNYYSIHFTYPNKAPVIRDLIVLGQ